MDLNNGGPAFPDLTGARCLICGWAMAEHSESQVRTCQHRHEELRKQRRDETVRRTMRDLARATAGQE